MNNNKASSGIMDIVSPNTVNLTSLTEQQEFILKFFTREEPMSMQAVATLYGSKPGVIYNHVAVLMDTGHIEKYKGKYRRTQESVHWAKPFIEKLRAKQNEI